MDTWYKIFNDIVNVNIPIKEKRVKAWFTRAALLLISCEPGLKPGSHDIISISIRAKQKVKQKASLRHKDRHKHKHKIIVQA